jgi:hypothetical protein
MMDEEAELEMRALERQADLQSMEVDPKAKGRVKPEPGLSQGRIKRVDSSAKGPTPTQVIELDSSSDDDGGYVSRKGSTGKKRVAVKEERGSGGRTREMDVIVLD